MIFRTHISFAFLVSLLFLDSFGGNKLLFVVIVLLSAGLPDIDHPNSKYGKKFWFLSKPFNFLFGHRKLFHSLTLIIILSFLIWKFFGSYWEPFAIGYISHLILDGFTLEGINFIYPIKQLRLSGFIETGKKQESLLFWLFVVIDLMLLYRVFF
jgi:inner membrane protein